MSVEFADYQKGGRVRYARFILGGLVNFPFRGGSSRPSGLPRLGPGEYFLTDESGAYLTDENGNYLIGKDA